MTTELERPPLQADEERTALVGWLDLQRQILRWKCEGLSDEDAHRPVIPNLPATTMAGLVRHMRWTEHTWLEVLFLGGDEKRNPSFDESSEDADWHPTAAPSPSSSWSTRPSAPAATKSSPRPPWTTSAATPASAPSVPTSAGR